MTVEIIKSGRYESLNDCYGWRLLNDTGERIASTFSIPRSSDPAITWADRIHARIVGGEHDTT